MLRLIVVLLTAATLLATSAFAGPGHSHEGPITEMEAIKDATAVVTTFVEKGRLDASWREVKATEAQKKKIKFGQEWVVTFSNPSEPNTEKKTLYVFFSVNGDYLRANFSGR